MGSASAHFQHATGREFYGLAGYHYSMPEWGFAYREGGQHIERWVVTIPAITMLVLFLASAAFMTLVERRSGLAMFGGVAYHVAWTVAFAVLAFWYSINITGVFI